MLWPHQEWEQSLFSSAALESLLYLQSFLHFNCGGLEVGWGGCLGELGLVGEMSLHPAWVCPPLAVRSPVALGLQLLPNLADGMLVREGWSIQVGRLRVQSLQPACFLGLISRSPLLSFKSPFSPLTPVLSPRSRWVRLPAGTPPKKKMPRRRQKKGIREAGREWGCG